jgi:NMD protein affecting ribosome stability and mRNA decay
MIVGKLLHTICPLCVYQELPVAKVGRKKVAFCPNGGDEKENTHTWFEVGPSLEGRVKYIEKPKVKKRKKVEIEEGGIADDKITRTESRIMD